MREKSHFVSNRAKRVWQRLSEFYGARIVDQFGTVPPEPWCEAIDKATDAAIQTALVRVRSVHLQYPPTLPELEAALAAAEPPRSITAIDLKSALCAWIVKHRKLTPRQMMGPWTWRGRVSDAAGPDKKVWKDWGVEFTGVEIPDDGDAPGFVVTFADMLGQAA